MERRRHYSPFKEGETWSFTTPSGKKEGFVNRYDALVAASTAERDASIRVEQKKAAKSRKEDG